MKSETVRSPWFAAILAALALAVVVAISIFFCDGRLVYTLDDPYIHMAVAHNILHGGYGVNLAEPSSPSSSILWPWMLSITEAIGLGNAGPLLLNAIAAVLSIFFGARLLSRLGYYGPSSRWWTCLAITTLLILATSALALPMTGLEHSWHVLAVVLAFEGLAAVANNEKPGALFMASLVLMPLIRFEGAAFAGAIILALFALGERRRAVYAAGLIGLGVGIYAAYMRHLHLPLLPSSVLLKSAVASSAVGGSGFLHSLQENWNESLLNKRGSYLITAVVLILIAAAVTLTDRDRRRHLAVYLCAVLAVIAHLVLGRYGWFYRYEVYANTIAALGVFYAFAHQKSFARWPKAGLAAGLVCAILGGVFVFDYWKAAKQTPLASRNMYEQQYQMRRFAQEYYDGPIAVNDLGLVSYQNKNFVLDLWGLGSEKVRLLRMAGQYGARQLASLVDDYHVPVIMIYEEWFKDNIPSTWKRVAILHNDHNVTAAQADVSFFITSNADSSHVTEALNRFKASLPAGSTLQVF